MSSDADAAEVFNILSRTLIPEVLHCNKLRDLWRKIYVISRDNRASAESSMAAFGGNGRWPSLSGTTGSGSRAAVVGAHKIVVIRAHSPHSITQTDIPSFRALSTRLALMPLPGQATTALGSASSI